MTTPPPSGPESDPSFRRTRQVIGDETLGWAIIGASTVARRHIVPAIRNQPSLPDTSIRYPISSARIVGVFSRDVARARQFADAMQIPHAFVNLADLLDRHDIHCVYVGGHPRHHTQATLAALAAGKHVLCETPMSLTMEDATAMAHTASSAGLQLGVNYARRADPAIQTMRQMLIDREIGDVLGGRVANMILLDPALHTWRLQPSGGGVLFSRTVHSVDLVRYLLRDEVTAVYGQSTLQILSNVVEEDIIAHLEMRRTGRIVQVHDSFLIPHNTTQIEIFGSAGTLVARHCFEDAPDSELLLIQNQRQFTVPLDAERPYRQSIARFNDAVRGQGPSLAGSGDGLRDLGVALAIRDSVRSGSPVAVSPTPRAFEDRSVL